MKGSVGVGWKGGHPIPSPFPMGARDDEINLKKLDPIKLDTIQHSPACFFSSSFLRSLNLCINLNTVALANNICLRAIKTDVSRPNIPQFQRPEIRVSLFNCCIKFR